ncbi:hypothetical protein POTOM_061389 [Populus tomentosa]|uniref:Uncharacterized protein n=1 Tax=Populus tomentosa TaxID=118781 RepID=A0A8X7XME9_POPTO|nr:hypothetical protein POTOM_061389 [Populus tomentosa]
MADQSANPSSIMEPKQQHPLHQIAETPTHKLLLKQWLKEEELIFNRISLKETQIDSVCKEITQLYIFFFLFHSISLLLLFNASSKDPFGAKGSESCKRSWIPSLCSLLCSLGIIWAVRYKNDVECHLEKLLEREKEDGQLLAKCVEELKKKGGEFDLLREVDALRRAKSLRVETKVVRKWSARDFVTLFFFSVSCLVLDTPDKSITVTRTDSCRGLDENQLFSSWVEKGIDIHRMKSFQILQSTTTSALLGQGQQKQSPVS